MDLETCLVAVYGLTDDTLATMRPGARVRQHGPAARLADSEGLTRELAGEFLGLATDRGLHRDFRPHYRAPFPARAAVHHTTPARGSGCARRCGSCGQA